MHTGHKHTQHATFIHLQLNTTSFSSNDPISVRPSVFCVYSISHLSAEERETDVRAAGTCRFVNELYLALAIISD